MRSHVCRVTCALITLASLITSPNHLFDGSRGDAQAQTIPTAAEASDPDAPPIPASETQTADDTSADAPETPKDLPMKLTEIEGISEYQLDNGVRILLFPDPSKEVVTVNMTVFVGSRHEGYGEAGMAHLLEHMLFKGTPSHPEVPKVLQDRGAKFNGTTWLDRTNYYETLPAGQDNLEFAIRLEADRLVNSNIRGEDLASEMTVVRNEFEKGENSPLRVLMQRIQAAAYEWHNYGRSTIGNRSDIERVPIVSLRRFYKKFYRPDNVMVVVAGKFDPETALRYLQTYFGPIDNPDTPLDPTYTVEPAQDGERTVVLRRVGEVPLVGVAYHAPAGSHPEYAAIKTLEYILGDEPGGRLYKQMVTTELASSVYALSYALAEPGLVMGLVEVSRDKSIEEARLKLVEVFERSFVTDPISQAELERARQNILKQRELEATAPEQIAIALSDWAAQGDWRLYFLFRDAIESLTAEEVQQTALRYFTQNNRTVGLFIPSEKSQQVSVPESPDLAARVRDYQGRESLSAGEAFDPDPAAIQKRLETGVLVNQIRYALLPKKTRGETVSLSMTLRFGTADSLKDKIGAVELLGLLIARGTQSLDHQALQDELTRLRAELSIDSTIGVLNLRVKTKRSSLTEVITLLIDLIKHPRLEASELDIIRRQVVSSLEKGRSEPDALAPTAARRAMSPYDKDDIRYVPTIDEEIQMYKDVDIQSVRDLHKNFIGAGYGELAVVGDFDPEQVKSQFRDALDDWVSDQPYVRVDRPANTDIDGQIIAIETPDKKNALLYGGSQYAIKDTSPEYAQLVLGNFILGGGSLSSRLGDRVRQKEGLSYGVGTGVSGRSKDDRVDFTIYAITNPGNKDKLLDVIGQEFARLRKDGVTADELERAKVSYLQQEMLRRTQDESLAALLVGNLFNERTMQHQIEFEQRIRDATVDSVNRTIREYLDLDETVLAVAGDFAANPAAEPAATQTP